MVREMSRFSSLSPYIASFGFIIFLFITCVDLNCFNKAFFHEEYKQMNTASVLNLSEEDLNKSTDALLDYLKGKRDDLDVSVTIGSTVKEAFNAKEISHMADVRSLYQAVLLIRLAAAILFLISLAYYIVDVKARRQRFLFSCCSSFLKTTGVMILFLGILAVWAFLDFNSFWTAFHRLVFSNDLWLLDPNTDLLINLFPAEFFFKLVFRIVASFTVSMLFLSGISGGILLYHRCSKKALF